VLLLLPVAVAPPFPSKDCVTPQQWPRVVKRFSMRQFVGRAQQVQVLALWRPSSSSSLAGNVTRTHLRGRDRGGSVLVTPTRRVVCGRNTSVKHSCVMVAVYNCVLLPLWSWCVCCNHVDDSTTSQNETSTASSSLRKQEGCYPPGRGAT
jgi:hypothetical protein